jgi:ribosomal-protein-alanine N-acetyltransferase
MFRPITKKDLTQLLAIEKATHIVPWTEDTFKVCFNAGYFGWAIEIENNTVGFIMISMQRDECHVLNVVVQHTHQGKGLGRQLMEYAMLHAKQQGAAIVYLEVRRSNSRAISLYRKLHFHQVGERKGYYPTVAGLEDALVFAKSLIED